MNITVQRLLWYPILCLGFLLQLLLQPTSADIFYKRMQIGPYCSFEISRLWGEEKIGWGLPSDMREVMVDFKAARYTGKEVFLDVGYIKLIQKASIEGAIREGIRQASNQPGISDFRYECADFFIPNSKAKTCVMSYQKNRLTMYYQTMVIVPNSDPNSAYILMGGYHKVYDKKVVERIFGSIHIQP